MSGQGGNQPGNTGGDLGIRPWPTPEARRMLRGGFELSDREILVVDERGVPVSRVIEP